MARFRINAKPYDGEYDLDLEDAPLSMLEWRWIKQLSGYMPATIGEGIRGADPDVQLALGVIALVRAGRVDERNVLDVAARLARTSTLDDMGEVEETAAEVTADPTTAPAAQVTELRSTNTGLSGPSTSENPEADPSPTGPRELPRSADSDPRTSLG